MRLKNDPRVAKREGVVLSSFVIPNYLIPGDSPAGYAPRSSYAHTPGGDRRPRSEQRTIITLEGVADSFYFSGFAAVDAGAKVQLHFDPSTRSKLCAIEVFDEHNKIKTTYAERGYIEE